jgi:hypothetical protein
MVRILFNSLGPNVTYHCLTEQKLCRDGDNAVCTESEAKLIKTLGYGTDYTPDLEEKTKNLLHGAQRKRKQITEIVKGGK